MLLSYCTALVAVVILAWVSAPHILHLPVAIMINGDSVSVVYGSEAGTVVKDNLEWADYQGDLLALDGSVLEPGGGADPVISARSRVLAYDYRIRSRVRLTVTRGEDLTEEIVEKDIYPKPPLSMKGRGPLRIVTDPGQIGLSIQFLGEISGQEQRREEKREPRTVEVRALSAASVKPKVVALTYDDGPNPAATEDLLRVLADEGVKATFFMLGNNVSKYPELAKKVADQGHQIGNHSQKHKRYNGLTPPKMEEDFSTAQQVIAEATGVTPVWARPPYGAVNPSVYSVLGSNSINLCMWNVDPADWREPGKQVIVNRVLANVRPGAVILMHDGGGDRSQTVRATRTIIRALKEEHYRFVTVQQLYDRIP